ncbi:uncharacterized protein LOC129721794 [Wyeomyia smithii]|uniref:uncharacterized protein LOC129721794 n=1 Tax=Wyeomyia smithii TaxID=174621 RepID=UPI002467DF0D|nr:uncharacterized protein LOC129721794 [Wyeomyia smithii]XP_055530766.1 uncharacterized protein LOC129721794 [Wyeomyia smithii]XP_055530768.1 uncharacterized protein LOC129721794 [Wyeomyia smithii]XP_055530769.1 uncharacterized protein LOC129721794 [Wyeomyia smithii]
MDKINELPLEILEHIFHYLPFKTWKICWSVCSLWYRILRGTHFQRIYCLSMNRTFEPQLSELEKRIFPSFRNIALVQWVHRDDDDDDDYEERRLEPVEKDEVTSLKYLFEPTPEKNISELLFSLELDFESLELCSSFGSGRDIIGNRLREIKNLRELILNMYVSHNQTSDQELWLIEHDRIETLKIDLTVTKINIDANLPNLRTLALLTDCYWAFHIIEKHCTQLESLEVQFHSPETMNNMLSLKFSAMTNLQAHLYRDKFVQENYKQTQNGYMHNKKEEMFIKNMPKLKTLYVESNLLLYRIAEPLSRFAHQLEELTLECQQIEFLQLKAIESMPNLKVLNLLYCRIASTRILPTVTMPLLEKLTLINNESHVIFDNGLCNLKSLKVTFWTRSSHKALHKICKKLFNLQKLELLVYSKLANTAFRELHNLTKLTTFRIGKCELKAIHWSHCSALPNLRRIVLTDCRLELSALLNAPLATIFPGLREFYFKSCAIGYSKKSNIAVSFNSDDEARQYCLQQLRAILPDCGISLHDSLFG